MKFQCVSKNDPGAYALISRQFSWKQKSPNPCHPLCLHAFHRWRLLYVTLFPNIVVIFILALNNLKTGSFFIAPCYCGLSLLQRTDDGLRVSTITRVDCIWGNFVTFSAKNHQLKILLWIRIWNRNHEILSNFDFVKLFISKSNVSKSSWPHFQGIICLLIYIRNKSRNVRFTTYLEQIKVSFVLNVQFW